MGAFAALGGLAAKGLAKLGGKIAGKAGGAKGTTTPQQIDKPQTHKEQADKKQSAPPLEAPMIPPIKSMKKGGSVRKTGLYHLHKGEHVVPAKGSGRKTGRKRTVIKA